jgi:hypothetical protein
MNGIKNNGVIVRDVNTIKQHVGHFYKNLLSDGMDENASSSVSRLHINKGRRGVCKSCDWKHHVLGN